jgi:ATP-dependent Lon protease
VEVKAVLGMFMGLAYVAVGGVTLHVAMNEKTWMKKSGIAEMLAEVTGPSSKHSPDGKGST